MGEYQPQPDDDDLVDVRGASAILNTPVKTIYSWCNGQVDRSQYGWTFIRFGRTLKFRKGDLRRYVHDNYHANGR